MFCSVLYFVTGNVKHLVSYPSLRTIVKQSPNYAGRRKRCRTCIADLSIGDCFVAHSLSADRQARNDGLFKQQESHSFPNGFLNILTLVS
jgi:hypothetical protein